MVERSQGTGKNWAEPGQCNSVAQLQHGLDEADARQRDRYPYAGEASRSVVFPDLAHSGRSSSAAWERRHWQWAWAEERLAGVVVARQVDKAGCVSL